MGARIAAGAFWGGAFLLFVALDLVVLGVVALNSALVTVLPSAGVIGGGLLGWVATRVPAVPVLSAPVPSGAVGPHPAAETGFVPTHVVPVTGLPARMAPDPVAPPIAELAPMLPVQVVDRYGDWAQVVCANGWSGWVDGRLLAPVEGWLSQRGSGTLPDGGPRPA
jgi:hypothetical protein